MVLGHNHLSINMGMQISRVNHHTLNHHSLTPPPPPPPINRASRYEVVASSKDMFITRWCHCKEIRENRSRGGSTNKVGLLDCLGNIYGQSCRSWKWLQKETSEGKAGPYDFAIWQANHPPLDPHWDPRLNNSYNKGISYVSGPCIYYIKCQNTWNKNVILMLVLYPSQVWLG